MSLLVSLFIILPTPGGVAFSLAYSSATLAGQSLVYRPIACRDLLHWSLSRRARKQPGMVRHTNVVHR
jgi:hypothetical protein